jgi:hypothetical protein
VDDSLPCKPTHTSRVSQYNINIAKSKTHLVCVTEDVQVAITIIFYLSRTKPELLHIALDVLILDLATVAIRTQPPGFAHLLG